MMRNKFWAAAALAIAIGTFAGSGVVHAESMPKDTVAEGVFIEQLDLSGMTISEAIDAVDDYIAGKTASKIRLNINDNWVEVTAGDMGLSCGNAEVVEEAFEYGKEGNIVQRYKTMKDLQNINKGMGKTVIVNIHSVELARTFSTRIIALKAGKMVFDGTPEELTDQKLIEIYGKVI